MERYFIFSDAQLDLEIKYGIKECVLNTFINNLKTELALIQMERTSYT